MQLLRQGANTRNFKPPLYDGRTDVELFIGQFNDVQAANGWNAAAALLHLRSCLVEDAVDCGSGATVEAIQANLRARFGLTPKQARDKLNVLERDANQSLHSLSVEAERLVVTAYPDMPAAQREPLAVEHFSRAVGDAELSQHLLVADTATMARAVQSAEDYLQAGVRSGKSTKAPKRLHLAAAALEPDTTQAATSKLDQVLERLDKLTAVLAEQARRGDSSGRSRGTSNHSRGGANQPQQPGNSQQSQKKIECYGCGGDHILRLCPNKSVNATVPVSGNEQRPRQ